MISFASSSFLRWRRAGTWLPVIALAGLSPLPAGSTPVVTVGAQFTGSSYNIQTSWYPPDTMGAVGPNYFVELINGSYRVYDKTTGAAVRSSSLDAFWSTAGATPTNSAFDPRILYDSTSQRWFAAAVDFGVNNANNSFLVAVSKSSDPTAGWNAFKIDADTNNSNWADFPTLGIDSQAVYIGANMFASPGFSGDKTAFLVIPKSNLLAATPTVSGATLFQDINPNNTGFSPQPVVNLDGGGISPNGEWMLSSYNLPAGFLKLSRFTGTATSPVLNTSGGFIGVTARNDPPPADQPSTTVNIDSGDTRFSGNVILQNGSIWAVQSANVNGRAGIVWYRIDLGLGQIETGVISNNALDYYVPSIAVNESNQIVVGFTGSGANQYASAYALVGEFNGTSTLFDPTGPMLLKAGTATWGLDRWGDYSATTIDPTNNHHFWTIQEYVSAAGRYSTYITELILSSPNTVPEPSSLALALVGLAAVARVRRHRG